MDAKCIERIKLGFHALKKIEKVDEKNSHFHSETKANSNKTQDTPQIPFQFIFCNQILFTQPIVDKAHCQQQTILLACSSNIVFLLLMVDGVFFFSVSLCVGIFRLRCLKRLQENIIVIFPREIIGNWCELKLQCKTITFSNDSWVHA